MNSDIKDWKSTELGVARRSTQQRFRIYLEELDFFSKEFQDANSEDNQYLQWRNGFAEELLQVIGDDLSVADLHQILHVVVKEIDRRLTETEEEYVVENSKQWLKFISSLKPCPICGIIAGKHLSEDCEEGENNV